MPGCKELLAWCVSTAEEEDGAGEWMLGTAKWTRSCRWRSSLS